MHNWYAMETEAEFRRQDWEREVIAATRAAQAQPKTGDFTGRGCRAWRCPT